jgi:uncharacterized SAM-binding protein YcdF (DUF218 family)
MTGRPGGMNRRWFAAGAVAALVLLGLGRLVINETEFADRLIGPLIVSDTPGPADAIVVMGAGVTGACEPNRNGIARVLLAVRLWKQKRAPVVVVTGGGGSRNPCPIAEAMARLALEVGLDRGSLHRETASNSTHENGVLTAPLLRQLGARRVLVVTDMLHMRRSAETFESLGFTVERAAVPVYAGHTDNVDMLLSAVRESAALTYYRMRGWLQPPAGDMAEGGATATAGTFAAHAAAQPKGSMSGNVSAPAGPIVVLGASYAGGWKLTDVAGVPVVNKGVAGEQSWEMLARFERDVVVHRPRAVILWGFINDVVRAPGTPEGVDQAIARARDSYEKMIGLARSNGIEPIVATEVTVRPSDTWSETIGGWVGGLLGKQGYHARINGHVTTTNRWLVERAGRDGILVLDLQKALADTDGIRRRREFTKEDGSHITPAGYAALTTYARPILEAHLRAAS